MICLCTFGSTIGLRWNSWLSLHQHVVMKRPWNKSKRSRDSLLETDTPVQANPSQICLLSEKINSKWALLVMHHVHQHWKPPLSLSLTDTRRQNPTECSNGGNLVLKIRAEKTGIPPSSSPRGYPPHWVTNVKCSSRWRGRSVDLSAPLTSRTMRDTFLSSDSLIEVISVRSGISGALGGGCFSVQIICPFSDSD